MITLRLKDGDNQKLSADDINNFDFIYNKQSNCIDTYKNGEYIGELISFCGMTDDEFLKAIKDKKGGTKW